MNDDGLIRAKIHLYRGQMVIAVCDSELIGKMLDNKGVPFMVSESFYGGPVISKQDLDGLLGGGGNMNILGRRSVEVAIEAGIVETEHIVMVGDVPHVQIYRIRK